jgi:molybdopterin converting factor small subunit
MTMKVPVRLSAGLAQATGSTRLVVTITEGATVADLLDHLRTTYPALGSQLETAVPTISGRHASATDVLTAGQEVALLLPIAGG